MRKCSASDSYSRFSESLVFPKKRKPSLVMTQQSRKQLKGLTRTKLKILTTVNQTTTNSDKAYSERKQMQLVFVLSAIRALSLRLVEALHDHKAVFRVAVPH